jgi:hypothetical protein
MSNTILAPNYDLEMDAAFGSEELHCVRYADVSPVAMLMILFCYLLSSHLQSRKMLQH